MKKCFKCGVEKPLSDYYKHAKMADGHLNKCKECAKTDVRKHRVDNDSVREYDRARGCRQDADYLANYRNDNPNKYRAHRLVGKLVKSGVLVKPQTCESCSTCGRLHGHHDDYAKPEVLRWLCAKCHHRWHAEHGEALNP